MSPTSRRDALDGAPAGRLRPGAGRGQGGRPAPIRSMARWRPSRRCRFRNLARPSGWACSARPHRTFCSTGSASASATGIKLGSATFELRARLVTEPDAVSDGFGFAPRLLVSLDGLRATGLIQPGSLVEFAYKIRLPADADEAGLAAIRTAAAEDFPQAGWTIRTRTNAAPALSSNIERFSQFLTLVGLTALVVGGVGVANAVRAYLDGKRGVIATFKSLGASGGFVFLVYLVQILLIAALGIVIGLVLGAAMPFVGERALLSRRSRCRPKAASIPARSALAALFGLLVTLAFALLPLGRARDVPATALFREMGFEGRGCPRLASIWRRRSALRRCSRRLPSGSRTTAASPRSSSARPSSPSWCCAGSAALVQWLARKQPARALDGAAAGDRQHPPARRPDAVGGAVARPRPDAAGHAGADRRQSAPPDDPAICRSGRRTSSSSTSRARRSTRFAGADRQRGAATASWTRCRCCAAGSWRSTAPTSTR